MLEARNVTIRHGERDVVRDVSLSLRLGEVVAVCGPNGAGKSSFVGALVGDHQPVSGSIEIDGVPLSKFGARDLALQRAVLEQSPTVSAPFLVKELVGLGAAFAPIEFRNPDELARDAMKAADVLDLADARTDRISGGEAARAHLARVLAQLAAGGLAGGGKYLLLDEPTASLDLSHQISTMRAVRQVAANGGGVIAVLHDLNLAAAFADRVLLLDGGAQAALGPPDNVFREDILSAVFGVQFQVRRETGGPLRIAPVYVQ